jgi:lipoate-protein ligase A
VIDDSTPHAATLNMAIDEVLLQTTRVPLLRFYRWQEPSISFGYFGRFDEAQQFAAGHVLVRRWTGGGIVPHGDDLTYSIMIHASDPAFHLSSGKIYRAVHKAIAHSLRSIGIQTSLAREATPKTTDSCFAHPVVADVIEAGRKIAGAAHRKTRIGLLHQGSIQRNNLGREFRANLAETLSGRINAGKISASVFKAAEKLAAEKYSTAAWLRRR